MESRLCLTCEFDYTYLAKLQNLSGDDFDISEVRYAEKVEADITCEPDDRGKVESTILNVTAGRLTVKNENILEIKIKI
ncbi:MAG: DUF1949 domain-containing protein [Anaerovoracaceae bacterium]